MRTHCNIDEIDVIAPNFKRRLSGVTSTIIQLVPLQAKMGTRIATLGPGLPDHLPFIRFRDLWRLWQKPTGKPARIWHARRNVEMVAGVVLRDVLRMPLQLVFTSAAQRAHRRFTRFLIRKMDHVVATNLKSASFLQVPHAIIPHGIDTRRFVADLEVKNTIRSGLALAANHKLIGCFGRIRHQKGTDLFVDAMIALLPRFPDWQAIICGRATEQHASFEADLRQRITVAGLSDRIRFLGEVPNILPYYQAIDLYIAPSRIEGFGLTPLEAMACGVPAVTTDAGAYSDMVHPGKNGEICLAGNGAALTLAVEKLIGNTGQLKLMAGHAEQFVREHFGLDREAGALQAVYDKMLKETD